ncbi:MAG: diacylglycerol kinase family lipid kinase [Bacteroidales bacterium]|nr:diacylglycerol kinase family lipid kinase [Bacteroidales bacterium]
MMQTSWKVIINGSAGYEKARTDWAVIEKLLADAGLVFSAEWTMEKYHAIEISSKAVAEGFRNFIAVGGDGTMHEVLNGILRQSEIPYSEFKLAVIPIGTGNDWGRYYKMPTDYATVVNMISEGHTISQDVAAVETVKNGKPLKRYMVNIGGIGFDADVCHKYEIFKERGAKGKILYLKGLCSAFFGHINYDMQVKIDGKPYFSGDLFSIALGIGKYSGGGMIQTPEAITDDGLLEVTLIRKVSRLTILRNIKSLFNGTLYSLEPVLHTKAKEVEVSATKAACVEVDGELVGTTPVKLRIMPKAINLVVPK